MKKDITVYLRHLKDCLSRIEGYVVDGREAFFVDTKTQDAVIRNLEIVGQVVRDIGLDELLARRPDIPWSQVAGTRNVLAHQYLGVDLQLVWRIVERDLPPLKKAVDAMVDELQSERAEQQS